MRSGSLRRYAVTTVAATTALAVTVSLTVASSAPAATVPHRPASVAHHHPVSMPALTPIKIFSHAQDHGRFPLIGKTVKITANGEIEVGSQAVTGYAYCLYHSYDWCLAMLSPTEWEAIVLGGLKIVKSLIEIYKVLKAPPDSDKDDKEGTVDGTDNQGNGMCFGAWGYNQHIHLGSCSSRHGIYWQFAAVPGGNQYEFALWNTYSRGYMTTSGPQQHAAIWIHSWPKDWQTWGLYS